MVLPLREIYNNISFQMILSLISPHHSNNRLAEFNWKFRLLPELPSPSILKRPAGRCSDELVLGVWATVLLIFSSNETWVNSDDKFIIISSSSPCGSLNTASSTSWGLFSLFACFTMFEFVIIKADKHTNENHPLWYKLSVWKSFILKTAYVLGDMV